jgi:DNA invertase Pin-like site-specific DNA recombinase
VTATYPVRAGQGAEAVRVGIYARLSKLKEKDRGRQLNLEGQVRRCRELIALQGHGWTEVDVYPDKDKTAAGRDPYRPEYERMMADLRAGRINAVVALDQDRLVREPFEMELMLRLFEDVGARHILTSEGEITEEGVLVARIRASVSSDEIRKMRARHKRKQEDIAMDGRWGGGFRPFGYDVVFAPDHPKKSNSGHILVLKEDEAELLREAARRIIQGEKGSSPEVIAQEWNEAGVRTVTGQRWRGSALRRIIQSATIAGLREHHGEVIAKGYWDPVLETPVWDAVRATIAAKPQAKRGRPPREYLLTGGLAVCGLCGAPLRARPRADKVRSYVCVAEQRADGSRPCGGVRCVAEPLEELIFEAVLAAVDEGALDAVIRTDLGDDGGRHRELVELVAEAERKLSVAAERYLEGDVTRADYERVKVRWQKVAADANAELVRIERTKLPSDLPRSVDQLREWWPEALLAQRRTFLNLFIEKVLVKPAPHRGARFSSTRVEISWLR